MVFIDESALLDVLRLLHNLRQVAIVPSITSWNNPDTMNHPINTRLLEYLVVPDSHFDLPQNEEEVVDCASSIVAQSKSEQPMSLLPKLTHFTLKLAQQGESDYSTEDTLSQITRVAKSRLSGSSSVARLKEQVLLNDTTEGWKDHIGELEMLGLNVRTGGSYVATSKERLRTYYIGQ
jgi:hypothetical protein